MIHYTVWAICIVMGKLFFLMALCNKGPYGSYISMRERERFGLDKGSHCG